MLKEGRSRPWQDILFDMTGDRRVNVQPFIEYFQPLFDWLKKQNKGTDYVVITSLKNTLICLS